MTKGARSWTLATIAALAAVLVGLLGVLAVDRAMRERALAETRVAAAGNAAILAAGLESELNKFSIVPRVLATDPEVTGLLERRGSVPLVLNRRLAALARQTNASAIYLMDARGTALAASNWDRPDSFIGSNYDFREYFKGALRSGTAGEFALGNTTLRPGLYLAERVGPARRPLGVIAVKVEFDQLESNWRNAEDAVFVTDGDGIVLITSDPAWRFRTTRPATAATRQPGEDRLRFGIAALKPMPDLGRKAAPLIEKIQPISPAGWELHLFADPAPRVAAALANGRLAVVLALMLAFAVGAALLVWQRRREARAEALLAEQTATLRDQLQQANRLATLGQVSAGVGHEIRQPVAAMRVYAETGEKLIAAGQNRAAAENFGQIIALTARIGAITEELLGFGRRAVHPPREMPLAQAIDGALLLLGDRIKRAGLRLDRPDPVLAQTRVRGESVRLEQVLINLLQNALDAVGEGGRIAIELAVDPEHCRLTVADSGPGIAPEVAGTLFQPFATTKPEGIGLGLAISFDIMRSLGGDLTCASGPEGARFTMVIPRA